jgi:predicted ATPase
MIKRIKIHNFKSLYYTGADLSPLTVLIGRSGTGKTNFIEAIRFWRDLISNQEGLQRFVMAQHGSFFYAGAGNDQSFGVEVIFAMAGGDKEFRYQLDCAFVPHMGSPTIVKEELLVDGRQVFSRQEGKWALKPPLHAVPNDAHEVMLGRLTGVPEARSAYIHLTQGVGCYDFPGTVLQEEPSGSANSIGLDDQGRNYLRVVEMISADVSNPQNLGEIIAALKKLNPHIQGVERGPTGRVEISHRVVEEAILTFKLAQQSEGVRRFLAHLFALYQLPPKPTLIFEEPEKGIYPGALAVLADHFRARTGDGKSQVILTTHSPQLLDRFPPESIRVVEMSGYQTKIGPLAADQVGAVKESLMTAGELLSVDEPRMDEAKAGA